MKIRPCNPGDAERMEYICLHASENPMTENPLFREAVLEVFCRYYLAFEAENCFVAVNEQDEAQGYILCAPDFCDYEKRFRNYLADRAGNPVLSMMAEGTLNALRSYALDYPAHLHIDLLPACQGRGIGKQLIHVLCEHLKENNIKGLMLNVSKDNAGAIRFYEKCGFSLLASGEQECAYGVRLVAQREKEGTQDAAV